MGKKVGCTPPWNIRDKGTTQCTTQEQVVKFDKELKHVLYQIIAKLSL